MSPTPTVNDQLADALLLLHGTPHPRSLYLIRWTKSRWSIGSTPPTDKQAEHLFHLTLPQAWNYRGPLETPIAEALMRLIARLCASTDQYPSVVSRWLGAFDAPPSPAPPARVLDDAPPAESA